jgi:hypothetical protein
LRFLAVLAALLGSHPSSLRGREALGEEAARSYAKVRQNCPEIQNLESRINERLESMT